MDSRRKSCGKGTTREPTILLFVQLRSKSVNDHEEQIHCRQQENGEQEEEDNDAEAVDTTISWSGVVQIEIMTRKSEVKPKEDVWRVRREFQKGNGHKEKWSTQGSKPVE